MSTCGDGGHESKYSVSDHRCTYIMSTCVEMVDMSLNTVFTDHHCTYIVSTGRDGGHESKYSVYRSSL